MKFIAFICVLFATIAIEQSWGKLCQCSIQTGPMGCIGETSEFNTCKDCSSVSCGDISSSCYPGYSPGFQCWEGEDSDGLFDISNTEYTVVEDDICDPTLCCCLVGDVTISKNDALFTIKSSTQGKDCPVEGGIDTTYSTSLYGQSFSYIQNFLGQDTLIEGTKQSLVFSPSDNRCSTTIEAKKRQSNRKRTIGLAVGIPLGVIFIVVIVVVVIIIRKKSFKKVPSVQSINSSTS